MNPTELRCHVPEPTDPAPVPGSPPPPHPMPEPPPVPIDDPRPPGTPEVPVYTPPNA
jgi:hypothetical protein